MRQVRSLPEKAHQSRNLVLFGRINGVSMIGVDEGPALVGRCGVRLLVDEIATLSIAAVTLLSEGVTTLSLVRTIVFHVDSELFRAMGELALLAV